MQFAVRDVMLQIDIMIFILGRGTLERSVVLIRGLSCPSSATLVTLAVWSRLTLYVSDESLGIHKQKLVEITTEQLLSRAAL